MKDELSKFDIAIGNYTEQLATLVGGQEFVNANMLENIARGLGPSIYLADASLVSCSDQEELNRVKENFLVKRCGLKEEGTNLSDSIQAICEKMSGIRQKYRAVFYYLLVEHEGLQGSFTECES